MTASTSLKAIERADEVHDDTFGFRRVDVEKLILTLKQCEHDATLECFKQAKKGNHVRAFRRHSEAMKAREEWQWWEERLEW